MMCGAALVFGGDQSPRGKRSQVSALQSAFGAHQVPRQPLETTQSFSAMNPTEPTSTLRRKIRALLWFFIFGLVVSGATAIPLETELKLLVPLVGAGGDSPSAGVAKWLLQVRDALGETNARFPFLAYGTDWLAFGHFVIALAFLGPLRDPVKNIWVIEFGMIACVLVVPFALHMGGVRGIPFGWRLIDCSFGVGGIIPLWICRRLVQQLAAAKAGRN